MPTPEFRRAVTVGTRTCTEQLTLLPTLSLISPFPLCPGKSASSWSKRTRQGQSHGHNIAYAGSQA